MANQSLFMTSLWALRSLKSGLFVILATHNFMIAAEQLSDQSRNLAPFFLGLDKDVSKPGFPGRASLGDGWELALPPFDRSRILVDVQRLHGESWARLCRYGLGRLLQPRDDSAKVDLVLDVRRILTDLFGLSNFIICIDDLLAA